MIFTKLALAHMVTVSQGAVALGAAYRVDPMSDTLKNFKDTWGTLPDRDLLYAIAQRNFVWRLQTNILHVCFSPLTLPMAVYHGDIREKIKNAANQWLEGTLWGFDWQDALGNFHECQNETSLLDYEIRVSINYTGNELFGSLIGSDAYGKIVAAQPGAIYTMALQFNPTSVSYADFFEYYTLHEFGHALGLSHEFQKAACDGVLKVEKVAQDFHIDPANLEIVLPNSKAFYDDTSFDMDSVMLYLFESDQYKNPNETRCRVTANHNKLSQRDRQGIMRLYGPQEPQLVANLGSVASELLSSNVALPASAQQSLSAHVAAAAAISDQQQNVPPALPPPVRTSVAEALINLSSPYIVATIRNADDDVNIFVNGVLTASWHAYGSSPTRLVLRPGENDIEIRVFNQRSFTGGIPMFGGHQPEGWSYSVNIVGGGGQLIADFGAREDRPDENGPRFGKEFTVARLKVIVDATGRILPISIDGNVWQHR
jgi:hypothetical protein